MGKISEADIKKFEEGFKKQVNEKLKNIKNEPHEAIQTRQYTEFKKQWMPNHLSLYEKACNLSEKILKFSPDKKEMPEMEEAIGICHLNITPAGAKSFSIVVPLALIAVVAFFSMLPALTGGQPMIFFILFATLVALILIIPLGRLPYFLANNWRLKASNQMVLCIFYMVTYMRHTSNLENALNFAGDHLTPPLSIDLKRVIWNVETEKYSSVKESLDAYLDTWKKWNMEFIESMHLVESSLYESAEERRINSLEKALSVMLEETYEKMLHYAHDLQSPLTMLHMLGIILPILGLVILPLVVSFMPEVKWYHLFTLYNVALPIGVYYLGRVMLSSRPTGYGETDISENNPEIKKYRYILLRFGDAEFKLHPAFVAIFVFAVLFLIGFSPMIMHMIAPNFDIAIGKEKGIYVIDKPTDPGAQYYFLGYRKDKDGSIIGPFGLGAAILSLFIPLSFGIGLGLYYKLRSQNVIKIRDQAKALEQEFAAALFQLGNRMGDGIPAEIAFGKVAEVMEGTLSGKFFELVSLNISKLGMSVDSAIFDKKHGALVYYPSALIESSMKVFVESSKKGPLVASQAVINVSEYIKEIHRVDERLKDLMADIISSMKSQISFLTPAIAGIVIGITSMITTILGSLSEQIRQIGSEQGGIEGMQNNSFGGLTDMFGNGIPTFYFQFIVGLYVVQIVYILTILVNGIQNGADSLSERYMLGKNLIVSTILYCAIALIIMLIFNIIAGQIIGGISLVQ